VKRIIVLGGRGQFGRTACEELQALGLQFATASRRGQTEIHVDANDVTSIRSTIQPGDIVLDTAGPFHERRTTLVESAIEIGFDVVDINDNLKYAESILTLAPRIAAADIRVLTSSSSVSAVGAAFVRHSRIIKPRRITAFLAPASRHTSNPGAALALIRSVGRPVRVFRDGQLQQRTGWSEARALRVSPPLGTIHGRLFESADAAHLPRIWPTLRDVAMYVDTNTFGVNSLLRFASHSPALRGMLERQSNLATRIARMLGSSSGGVGYEIEDTAGQVARYAIVADKSSFITAVAPAVLAAQAIAENRFPHRGLVPVDRQVEPADLFAFLHTRGIPLHRLS
jgi:saccharopine dehydrogenase-like NADP-dependent oxidoreductase